MRHADEKRERPGRNGSKRGSSDKKWGDYHHFSPDADAKVAIKEKAAKALPELTEWLSKRVDSGYSVTIKYLEERDAVRAEMRAPGEDRMLAPAIAAYHADALIALCALWYADTMGNPEWAEQRMTAKEVHNW